MTEEQSHHDRCLENVQYVSTNPADGISSYSNKIKTVVGHENGSNTQSSHLHTSSIESMILDSWTSFRSLRVRDLWQRIENIAAGLEIVVI